MVRRTFAVVLVALMLPSFAPSASAAAPIRGRSADAQAALDVRVAPDATAAGRRVQILTQLCRRPAKLRGCAPIDARLRRALEGAIDARIAWVHRRDRGGPEFLVFAPVRFDGGVARSEVAWWDSGRGGCRGATFLDHERQRGAWVVTDGLGWALCADVA